MTGVTNRPAVYTVFRRSDGYVGATNSSTREQARVQLFGWTTRDGEVTFELLLQTHDWDEARELIAAERAKPDYPAFDWA